MTFIRINYRATAGLTESQPLRPIPHVALIAAVAVIPPQSVGQVDLLLCMIRFHRRVPTQSKHSHASPMALRSTLTYGANFSQRLWSSFLTVDADRSGSISVSELRQ